MNKKKKKKVNTTEVLVYKTKERKSGRHFGARGSGAAAGFESWAPVTFSKRVPVQVHVRSSLQGMRLFRLCVCVPFLGRRRTVDEDGTGTRTRAQDGQGEGTGEG